MKNIQNQSIKLLEELCSPLGISASRSNEGNYQAVFARDAIMAGLAGLHFDNEIITEGLINTLKTLKRTQKSQGQIASNIQLTLDGNEKVSYGTLSYKTDSCCFYLIGVGISIKHDLIKAADWKDSIYKTLNLLEALEYNGRHLFYVPQGGNWADEYPYHGYLLFDQALRLWGIKLMADIFEDIALKEKAHLVEESLKANFHLKQKSQNVYHEVAYERALKDPKEYYLSGFTPAGYRTEFDLAANAITTFIINTTTSKDTLKWISSSPVPISAFWPTINPGDDEWRDIANFYLFEFKNNPGHYHNGGVWWIWLGWLRQSYLRNGLHSKAKKLQDWAELYLDNVESFDFDEYLERSQLTPSGTKFLAYTATGILFLTSEKTFDPKI